MIKSTPATALIRTKRKTEVRCSHSCKPPGPGASGDESAGDGPGGSRRAKLFSCGPGEGLSPAVGAPDNGILESVLTRRPAKPGEKWPARFCDGQDFRDEGYRN